MAFCFCFECCCFFVVVFLNYQGTKKLISSYQWTGFVLSLTNIGIQHKKKNPKKIQTHYIQMLIRIYLLFQYILCNFQLNMNELS